MTDLEKQLMEDLKMVLSEGQDDPCSFCEYQFTKCNEDCDCYQKGTGMQDEEGNYYNWKWTCMDWDYGTCDKLINSPCHNCFETNLSNWKYKTKEKRKENV